VPGERAVWIHSAGEAVSSGLRHRAGAGVHYLGRVGLWADEMVSVPALTGGAEWDGIAPDVSPGILR